ncbi:hypothetical protein LINPERHAP2_LOCUS16912, partial [Linum perenne]
ALEISSSNRFANVSFWISVSLSGASQIIFLDEVLVRWMEDVIQAAMEVGWKFGKGLVNRSGSRALQVGTILWKAVNVLRILENCDVGERFFVAISADEAVGGWNVWLKSLQSVVIRGQGSRRMFG